MKDPSIPKPTEGESGPYGRVYFTDDPEYDGEQDDDNLATELQERNVNWLDVPMPGNTRGVEALSNQVPELKELLKSLGYWAFLSTQSDIIPLETDLDIPIHLPVYRIL